jgi:four helix bundle protein
VIVYCHIGVVRYRIIEGFRYLRIGMLRAQPIAMTPQELRERTRQFALRVVRFCRTLPPTGEAQELAGQVRRSANSVAANYRAAGRARSRAEFAARIGVVLEEADESDHRLAEILELGLGDLGENRWLKNESLELCKIFGRSYQTACRSRGPRR